MISLSKNSRFFLIGSWVLKKGYGILLKNRVLCYMPIAIRQSNRLSPVGGHAAQMVNKRLSINKDSAEIPIFQRIIRDEVYYHEA